MWQVLLVCALVVGALGDACTSAGGYDLSAFKDNTHKWEWRQPVCVSSLLTDDPETIRSVDSLWSN
jgi:hypothetical protein